MSKCRIVYLETAFLILVLTSGAHADAPLGRYVVTSGTVYDNKTKLTWQQSVVSTTYTWSDAKSRCTALGAGWRLPALRELLSIVDYSQSGPAIDRAAFPGTPSLNFWSSSPYAGSATSAWSVSFQNGRGDWESHSTLNYVRCVR